MFRCDYFLVPRCGFDCVKYLAIARPSLGISRAEIAIYRKSVTEPLPLDLVPVQSVVYTCIYVCNDSFMYAFILILVDTVPYSL